MMLPPAAPNCLLLPPAACLPACLLLLLLLLPPAWKYKRHPLWGWLAASSAHTLRKHQSWTVHPGANAIWNSSAPIFRQSGGSVARSWCAWWSSQKKTKPTPCRYPCDLGIVLSKQVCKQ